MKALRRVGSDLWNKESGVELYSMILIFTGKGRQKRANCSAAFSESLTLESSRYSMVMRSPVFWW